MQRFKRIAHRGWLRRAITVATFGYYPRTDGERTIIADWCIGHKRLHEWALGCRQVLHRWTISDSRQYEWTTQHNIMQQWAVGDSRQYRWSIRIYTVECQ